MRTLTLSLSLIAAAQWMSAQNAGAANRASTPPAAVAAKNEVTWGAFARSLASPQSIGTNALGAGLAQWSDEPTEWEQGASGYFKRFGSRVGQRAIKGGTSFGIAALRHESRHYEKSTNLTGVFPRLKYAVIHTWWVNRTDGSGQTVAVGRIAGNVAAGGISRAWMPPSHQTWGHGITASVSGMGWDTAYNVVREFWPWKKFRP